MLLPRGIILCCDWVSLDCKSVLFSNLDNTKRHPNTWQSSCTMIGLFEITLLSSSVFSIFYLFSGQLIFNYTLSHFEAGLMKPLITSKFKITGQFWMP